MNRLIIIGASGHGKVVADIARLNGYSDIVFLDNNSEITKCASYPVLGPDTMTAELQGDVFVAIGNAVNRRKLMEREQNRFFPVLIHPQAVVAKDVVIGKGTVVMGGTVINPNTKIGQGVIINTASSVDHDCEIEDYVHVSVGAHLCGTVRVGMGTWVGAGAIVSNNVDICADSMIGAGAVVVKNITEAGTYIGVPVRKYR